MDQIRQTVIGEIMEKLDACNKMPKVEPMFSIGKDMISLCPNDADMRDFIDPLMEHVFYAKGFGYLRGLSCADELAFAILSDVQKNQWAAQKITVRVKAYTTCYVEGIDELEEELRRMYNVQHEEKWTPACCDPFELGLGVTICGCFLKFMTEIVIPGLEWDATKYVFSSLWKGIEKLSKRTEGFEIRSMEFKFDDITIEVDDVMANNYGSIMQLFMKMYDNVQYLSSKGIKNINEIKVPYVLNENTDNGFSPAEPCVNYEHFWWKVWYSFGCEYLFYNPDSKEMRTV